jgi:hypothetical protein
MIGGFIIRHPQITYITMIGTKLSMATLAEIPVKQFVVQTCESAREVGSYSCRDGMVLAKDFLVHDENEKTSQKQKRTFCWIDGHNTVDK